MSFWSYREQLSHCNKLRRSYYEILRDDLDQLIINYALLNSYDAFMSANIPYPFVEKRELKPRARIPAIEYDCQKSFLILFVEDIIPNAHKKYIRFFDVNKTSKINLMQTESLSLSDQFMSNQKYLDSIHFNDFLKTVLPIDYALLIQRDPTIKKTNKYCLTHFHVKIDWPIAEASEDLAKNLRYISKDLYERGDKYAEDIQKKFFEYYGMPLMAGGRRTAAIVAAQYLKQIPCISTVYVGSSESRALIKISERGVSKFVLMKLTNQEMVEIAEENDIPISVFKKIYILKTQEDNGICVFQTSYSMTNYGTPPDDGKLRQLNPDLYWLTVKSQQILPKSSEKKISPIPYNVIYT